MSKTIEYSEKARKELLAGVEAIAKAVRVTLGPSGRNVLIRNGSDPRPFSTKDGVTVAAQLESDNYIEQIAIEAFQEIANDTDSGVGDGTTTAIILGEAIFKLGITSEKLSNVNFIEVKRGIDTATKYIVKRLHELGKSCQNNSKQLKQVAMISSNNDEEIANVVINAFEVSGDQGVVNIKRSRTNKTYLTTIEGMNLSTGYINPVFVNDYDNNICDFENPYIYITNESIGTATPNFSALIEFTRKEKKPLLIICKDMDVVLSGMLAANIQKGLKICICKAPGFGEQMNEELRDLGTVLGKLPFLEGEGIQFNDLPIEEIMNYIPQSEGIMASDNNLSIKGPKGLDDKEYADIEKKKSARISYLRKKLEKHTTTYEQSEIQTRISRLVNGIAYIHIGYTSDIEYNEKQHRITDSLYAVKSAYEEGIIPGGGATLLFLSKEGCLSQDKNIMIGCQIVFDAIREPFIQILANVGLTLKEGHLKDFSEKWNTGIDARTLERCDDMIKFGIIDPVKVTRVALENAASIAGMLLTTDCVIIDKKVYEEQPQQQQY